MSLSVELVMPQYQWHYLVPPVVCAIPLLGRYLTRKPVTQRLIARAISTAVAIECWMALSDAVNAACQRGMLSQSTAITTIAVLFVTMTAGSIYLTDRYYPEEEQMS